MKSYTVFFKKSQYSPILTKQSKKPGHDVFSPLGALWAREPPTDDNFSSHPASLFGGRLVHLSSHGGAPLMHLHPGARLPHSHRLHPLRNAHREPSLCGQDCSGEMKWRKKQQPRDCLNPVPFKAVFVFGCPASTRVLQERGGKKLRVGRSFSFWGSRCAPLIAVLASDLNGRSMSAKDWQSLHRFGPNWKKVPTWREEWNDKQKHVSKPKKNGTLPETNIIFSAENWCLEDYILSFLDHLFRCDADIAIPLPPHRGSFTIGHTIFHQVKTSALSRRLCFLAGKEWRISFAQGKIEGLWVKWEGFSG